MKVNKREFIALSAGSAVAVAAGTAAVPAFAKADLTAERIKEFAGGKAVQEGKVTLDTPEIAENGNTVPVSFSVESPMTDDNHVKSVMLLADGNPAPGVATFNFTPMSGAATATTRIRLSTTQNIVAVAKMSDGSVFTNKALVKVTIGGCGG